MADKESATLAARIDTSESQEVTEGFFESLWRGKRYAPGTAFRIGLAATIAIGLAVFHLYTSAFGILEAWRQRSLHLGAVLLLIYLLPGGKEQRDSQGRIVVPYNHINWLFVVLSLGVLIYMMADYRGIIMREGIPNKYDLIATAVLIPLVLEAARRMCGWTISVIGVILLVYTKFGYLLPGPLGLPGYSYSRIASYMFNSTAGIFTVPLGAAAVYIVMFLIFAAFLLKSGVGEFFIQLSLALAGHLKGGPAKVAIFASALFATIHGSGPGNVAATGSFTIPMMKRLGYRPQFAGAVEAAASTGGIITPPVMGAAAFIIAEFTGVSYWTVCVVAAIPAVLYFLGVYFMVHLEAAKMNLEAIPKEDLPKLKDVLLRRGYMIIPIVVIFYFLISGASPMKAGFWATVSTFVLSLVRKETRMGPLEVLSACESGARSTLMVSIACAAAGIIVGSVSLTGLGLKISGAVAALAGNHLILSLLLTMAICIFLGMGMPVAPAYIITVTIAGLGLQKLGVPVLLIHMFVFYYGTMAAVTPPVALSAFAGAAIAGANQMKTGFTAFKLALPGFIIPFVFIYAPSFLIGFAPWHVTLVAFVSACISVIAVGAALQGYWITVMKLPLRVLCGASGLLLIVPGVLSDAIGLTVLAIIFAVQLWLKKRNGSNVPADHARAG